VVRGDTGPLRFRADESGAVPPLSQHRSTRRRGTIAAR